MKNQPPTRRQRSGATPAKQVAISAPRDASQLRAAAARKQVGGLDAQNLSDEHCKKLFSLSEEARGKDGIDEAIDAMKDVLEYCRDMPGAEAEAEIFARLIESANEALRLTPNLLRGLDLTEREMDATSAERLANQAPAGLPADYPIHSFGIIEEQCRNWLNVPEFTASLRGLDALRLLIGPHPAFAEEMQAIQMLVDGYCRLNERLGWVRDTIEAMIATGAWQWKGGGLARPQLPEPAAALPRDLWNYAAGRKMLDDACCCIGALAGVLQHNPQLAEVSRQMNGMDSAASALAQVMGERTPDTEAA